MFFPTHWAFRQRATRFTAHRGWLLMIVTALMVLLLNLAPQGQARNGYPPMLDPHVNNYGQVLTSSDAASLRSTLKAFKAKTGKQVVVVTIRSIQDYKTGDSTIESFATRLFNTWRIGDAVRNDGVMVLVAPDDRKVRIELGKGYSSDWNEEMQIIIEEYMIPDFKKDLFSQGTVRGTEALLKRLGRRPPNASPPSPIEKFFQTGISTIYVVVASILGGFISCWVVISRWLRYRKRSCPHCGDPMMRLDEQAEDQYLSRGQQLEENLKSVDYDVWRCSRCNYDQILSYGSWFSHFHQCPRCRKLTMEETRQTISRPTTYSTGLEAITQNCRSCSYHNTYQRSIPCLSDSDGGSSGSSGGGGSSSGGGATGSW